MKDYNIISTKDENETFRQDIYEHTAIIVNLYYVETLETYWEYLVNIPEEIKIFIISSNEQLLSKLTKLIDKHKCDNFTVLSKQNRGRDISALLVIGKKIIADYRYICFLHDKKHKYKYMEEDVNRWVYSLWHNMLASDVYIRNLLGLFEKQETLGVLVPPEPMGEHLYAGYGDSWGNNYNNVEKVLDMLGVNIELNLDHHPITLGTVFWCRTEALKKLFEYDWKYEDFDAEPLPNDGTISHAIERVIEYVAKDSGYTTERVVSDLWAEEQLSYIQKQMKKVFGILNENLGIKKIYELQNLDEQKKEILEFCNKNHNVYLYGAGKRGKDCLKFLRFFSIEPVGFVVTNKEEAQLAVEGVDVYGLEEIRRMENIAVIISVEMMNNEEIRTNLNRVGITNYIEYLRLYGDDKGKRKVDNFVSKKKE